MVKAGAWDSDSALLKPSPLILPRSLEKLIRNTPELFYTSHLKRQINTLIENNEGGRGAREAMRFNDIPEDAK